MMYLILMESIELFAQESTAGRLVTSWWRRTMNKLTHKIIRLGYYMPSHHNASSVISTKGVSPTVMQNHGTVIAIVEEQDDRKKSANN